MEEEFDTDDLKHLPQQAHHEIFDPGVESCSSDSSSRRNGSVSSKSNSSVATIEGVGEAVMHAEGGLSREEMKASAWELQKSSRNSRSSHCWCGSDKDTPQSSFVLSAPLKRQSQAVSTGCMESFSSISEASNFFQQETNELIPQSRGSFDCMYNCSISPFLPGDSSRYRAESSDDCSERQQQNTIEALKCEAFPETATLYEELGVPITASADEIRRVYYALCKLYHPDKCIASSACAAKLWALQQAYRVLGDEAKRLLYDINIGLYEGKEKQKRLLQLASLQRRRTARDIENMAGEYRRKLQQERALNGLIIRKAWYGNLRLKKFLREVEYLGPVTEYCLEGPFLDVTIPLQCQVDASRFVFSAGAKSTFESVKGFHNPALSVQHIGAICLYILYSFQGLAHEVTVCEGSSIAMPLKRHRIPVAVGPRGPYAPCNVALGSRSSTSSSHTSRTGVERTVRNGWGRRCQLSCATEDLLEERDEDTLQRKGLNLGSSILLCSMTAGVCLFIGLYRRGSDSCSMASLLKFRIHSFFSKIFPLDLYSELLAACKRVIKLSLSFRG